jgi:RimJ/RimL family protein N-acetyltransferase
MQKGLMTIVLDEDKVVSCAKLFPWQEANDNKKGVYEFGSWKTHPDYVKHGLGSQVAYETVKLGKSLGPNVQIVAAIEVTNYHAQQLLMKLGAEQMSKRPNEAKVLLQEGQADLVWLDMTYITGGENV